ncbi:cysteine hydrolase family protein [Halalkalibacter urbisdiaboli]|uniref:cysteine hydrolase family protein n=1 Tax=Halalkalibacter urbisdiaboli TaxID=1960589 RepID=UPI000B44ED48|nr:isochorismatase family cysteine hydrolase [Halalkalibacter urbisdiaboli]
MPNEALLIVDMSHDFVADNGNLTVGKPAQKIIPYIIELANTFLTDGKLVFITMDAHEENDAHFDLWPPHNVVGTKGQTLYGDLADWYEQNKNNNQLRYVPKTDYNAFFNTNLAQQLRDAGVDKVHVVGVCTDICDFLTIAGANAEGFKTAIHKQGCATFTNLGETMMHHMNTCFHTEIIG